MKAPAIRKCNRSHQNQRGVTIILVALSMVGILAMAALSIDVVTLYLARLEAQRSADTAALAAARVLSMSGITGDPANTSDQWPIVCTLATQVAKAVGSQSTVAGISSTVTVTYLYKGNTADCSAPSEGFGVNPQVQVQVQRTDLPSFFARMWGSRTTNVAASAVAEAFNPSGSYLLSGDTAIIPVQPRCVKPWVIPNFDPLNPGGCTGNCAGFVDRASGAIQHPGISLNGSGSPGVIGETFWLVPDCDHGNPNNCSPFAAPQANYPAGSYVRGPPNLLGLPGRVGTSTAIPSCSAGDPYEEAIEGCDSPLNYQCGAAGQNAVDLTKHNPGVNSITNAVQCLIHQTDATNITSSSGQDYLQTTGTFGDPSSYPYQILAGSSNPLGVSAGTPITSSNSVVSLPIYDQVAVPSPAANAVTNVTFIGFLQVFINAVDVNGNRLVTVLNVAGCGNGSNPTGNPVTGSSPVPVRLITPQ